ncbi:MAG TPA: response regulator [Steroidobacteraceae bacterium]
MSAKCALVVDDSKSARTFLAKMLEKYELDVVSVESAEQAIEYLGHHRPDVIFMDHMMPGMDGFQAVQTIKNNPRTATIPIMMYTSQEGELYVGQARALGAVGVLPKQIKPADVSKVLYQLHLLQDRRSTEQSTFRPVSAGDVESDEPDSPVPDYAGFAAHHSSVAARPLTEAALREQIGELRRAFGAALENQIEGLKSELHAAAGDFTRTDAFVSAAVETPKRGQPWTALAAALAGVIAVASLVIAAEQAAHMRALTAQIAALRTSLGGLEHEAGTLGRSAPSVVPSGSGSGGEAASDDADANPSEGAPAASGAAFRGAPATRPVVEVVPYGEDPFSGPRLDSVRQLFDRLAAQGYRGVVEVREFSGRFCLAGNATDGYALAPDEAAYARCDVIGGSLPRDDSGAPRVSVAFADLAAELRSASHGAIDVQVVSGDDRATLVAYPPISDSLTAGEWNRAAGANNRIEIRLR